MKRLDVIFAVAPDCHTRAGHYGTLWRKHFYEGLRGAVRTLMIPHDLDFDWARSTPPLAADRPVETCRFDTSLRLWEQIQAFHAKAGLDAVISYCFAGDIDSGVVKNTLRLGVPWINFYCDSTHRFGGVAALAQVVSLNWFPEQAAIPRYAALGVPHLCQPYALNASELPELSCQTPRYPVTFIGLPTANRITQLGKLSLLGCSVAVRGRGWVGEENDPFQNPARKPVDWLRVLAQPGLGEKLARRVLWPLVRRHARCPLNETEFHEHLRQSEIVLGLNQGRDEHGRLMSYLKFRDVEFPGYGCCYLTEHNEDIERAFAIGEEILTFKNIGEAAEQIRRYRRDPGQAKQIGMAGRRRVLADHTWPARLNQIAEGL